MKLHNELGDYQPNFFEINMSQSGKEEKSGITKVIKTMQICLHES